MEVYDGVVPDFIVRRKRKRAVDPCLGFYTSSPPFRSDSPLAARSLAQLQSEIDQPRSIPSSPQRRPPSVELVPIRPQAMKQVNSSNPMSHVTVVTVEDFLRRSVERPIKNYSRKRHRVVDLRSHEVPDLHSLASDEDNDRNRPPKVLERRRISAPQLPSSSESSYRALPVSKTSRRKSQPRNAKSLAQRIIAAAILSHVEPDQDPATSSRRPLPFVSDRQSRALSPEIGQKHQTRSLVDPRKTIPFNQATFASRTCDDHLNTPRLTRHKPLTKWRTTCEAKTPGRPPSRKVRKAQGIQRRALDCPPLLFIPVHDAEVAYASKMLLSDRHSSKHIAETAVDKPANAGDRGPQLLLFPVHPLKPQKVSTESSHPRTVESSSPASHAPSHESRPIHSAALANEADCETSQSPGISVPETVGSLPMAPVNPAMVADKAILSSEIASPTITAKPLKALTFFLDGFLETARNANQMQASTTSQRRPLSGRRLRKISRLTSEAPEDPNHVPYDTADANSKKPATPLAQPISFMKTFIGTSIRNGYSASQVHTVVSDPPEVNTAPSHFDTAILLGPKLHLRTMTPIRSLTRRPLDPRFLRKDSHESSRLPLFDERPRTNPRQHAISPSLHIPLSSTLSSPTRHIQRPGMTPIFETPSSPNILLALQPQQHQVMVFSSPTQRKSRHRNHDLGFDDVGIGLDVPTSIDLFAGLGHDL